MDEKPSANYGIIFRDVSGDTGSMELSGMMCVSGAALWYYNGVTWKSMVATV